MKRYTPLQDRIQVVAEVLARGYRRIAVVFLHGLGDTLMFRSVFEALRVRLAGIEITPFLLATQEDLLEGGRPWEGEQSLHGFDAAFVIQFPMSEGTGIRKADYCARQELGLNGEFEIAFLKRDVRAMVAVHFQGTALPDSVNPSADVCRQISEEIVDRGYVPVEAHFEHAFHNPVNAKYDWLPTTLRGNVPSIDKLYSLIDASACFIGVASGPFIMALAIDPNKVIYLQKHFALTDYTAQTVSTVDVLNFDRKSFSRILDERLPSLTKARTQATPWSSGGIDADPPLNDCHSPNEIELRILRAKSRLPLSDRDIIEPVVQCEHEHFPEYFSSNQYYAWYYAIGQAIRPRRIAEIGVRYGYSLWSLAKGSSVRQGVGAPTLELYGFDNESYNCGSCAVAEASLRNGINATIRLRICDTRLCDALEVPEIDLFHVDGDHTRDGAIHDCELAYRVLRPGGLLLLDDVDSVAAVRVAGDEFCQRIGQSPIHLPTFRGLYVIRKS